MNWLLQIQASHEVAYSVTVLSLVAILGLAIGNIRIRGISLGVAGVLFAGILFGHLGLRLDESILEFIREFGLILFVYTIGTQVGRGFFASLREQGLPMNLLAAGIILMGGATAIACGLLFDIPMPAILGVMAGATTNTPSLGAMQDTLRSIPGMSPDLLAMPGLGYAVAYPGAIAGLIFAMILLRMIFRIDLEKEREERERRQAEASKPPERASIRVENENLVGLKLASIPGMAELEITITRMRPVGLTEVVLAKDEMILAKGDVILAVGTRASLERFELIVGSEIEEDLRQMPSSVSNRRVVVTHRDVLGKTLTELALRQKYGVTVTRVTRADLEMTAVPNLQLQFGDMLNLVGREEDVARTADLLGNSARALNQTNILAIFVGIALGVFVGLLPIEISGLPVPLRLGLAGGPLIVAILISRLGRIGPIIWHMPLNANIALRELGLTLFLACVGLKSGEKFLETLSKGDGFLWMACGLAVTLVPVLVGGIIGRLVLKLDFASLSGILAGSNTDPPALAFATDLNKSDSPNVSYATVYPMTLLLRILTAQVLTIVFCVA
ncbi:MAG: putative transporter [Thermoanaerobaculia bacterium]